MLDNTVQPINGIEFYDATSDQQLKYVYPDSQHSTAGWLLYRTTDDQWVTLRKATDEDIAAINEAIVEAHHGGDE